MGIAVRTDFTRTVRPAKVMSEAFQPGSLLAIFFDPNHQITFHIIYSDVWAHVGPLRCKVIDGLSPLFTASLFVMKNKSDVSLVSRSSTKP